MHDMLPLLEPVTFPAISRRHIETLQVNIGLRCNLACLHCHTNSNPYRREAMDEATLELILHFLQKQRVPKLDITGGAPELHPGFRRLVAKARTLGVHVMDRCNLTVLEESEHEDLHEFLAGMRVEIIASLPCYTRDNVDQQRGKGVFDASMAALRKLNAIGYGHPQSGLVLNLVYNPLGPFLPPSQRKLEQTYKNQLLQDYGIVFNDLFTICNMPIKRFGSMLVSKGQFTEYANLLRNAHRDENLDGVMCRALLSVDWKGYVYDCDFNQMLELPLSWNGRHRTHLSELLDADMNGNPIQVREHCYGCTAGQGSSCGGALSGG